LKSTALEADLMYLAGNQLAAGDYAAAEQNYLRLLAIKEATSGAEHTDLVVVLRALANFYRTQGRLLDAEATVRRTLKLWDLPSAKLFGVDFSEIGRAHELQSLAAVLVDQNQIEPAKKLASRALALLEADLARSRAKGEPPGNGTLGRVQDGLMCMVNISRLLGNEVEAKQLFDRALALRSEMQAENMMTLPKTWGQAVLEIRAPIPKP